MSSRLPGLCQKAIDDTARAAAHGAAELAASAKRLLAVADREVADCQAAAASVWRPACRMGCDSCCYRLVEATLPEVLLVAKHVIETYAPSEVDALRRRIEAAQATNAPLWQDQLSRPIAACPFLQAGECSIYELRPISCRAANSADAKACVTFYREGKPAQLNPLREQLGASTLARAALVGCQEAGLATGLFELGPAVDAVLGDPDLPNRLRGKAPELERVKIFSEHSSVEEPLPASLQKLYRDPVARDLAKFHGVPDIQDFRRRLNAYRGSAFHALYNLRMPQLYESAAEAAEEWSALDSRLDEYEAYAADARELFELVQGFSLFRLAYTDADVAPVMRRFMTKLHAVALSCFPEVARPIERPRRPGKIRLGFVGSRVQTFNGSRWALGVVSARHPDVETHVINLGHREDSTSFCFRRAADFYWHMPAPVTHIAADIRGLDLDALVFTDVGMDGKSLQLASLRLARRQFAGWGHPATSGSPTMDFYLSAEHMEPADGDAHYSERLIRLPKNGLSTPYRQLRPSPLSASELGVPDGGFILFGQLLQKIHPSVDSLFREIADRSPIPLVILGGRGDQEIAVMKRRLGERNIVYLPLLPADRYLRVMQLAEASLESPSFGGAFTALDALTLGTPVITLPGRFMRARLSRGYLVEGGAPGLIARDREEYIELCLSPDRRHAAMANLDVEPMYDNAAAIAAFHDMLLE